MDYVQENKRIGTEITDMLTGMTGLQYVYDCKRGIILKDYNGQDINVLPLDGLTEREKWHMLLVFPIGLSVGMAAAIGGRGGAV